MKTGEIVAAYNAAYKQHRELEEKLASLNVGEVAAPEEFLGAIMSYNNRRMSVLAEIVECEKEIVILSAMLPNNDITNVVGYEVYDALKERYPDINQQTRVMHVSADHIGNYFEVPHFGHIPWGLQQEPGQVQVTRIQIVPIVKIRQGHMTRIIAAGFAPKLGENEFSTLLLAQDIRET